MGEYWKPVNLTKNEYIHPHHWGCGLKLGEWNYPGSLVHQVIETRWAPTDDVRAVSDYGGQMQLSGSGTAPFPDYWELSERFTEVEPSSDYGD